MRGWRGFESLAVGGDEFVSERSSLALFRQFSDEFGWYALVGRHISLFDPCLRRLHRVSPSVCISGGRVKYDVRNASGTKRHVCEQQRRQVLIQTRIQRGGVQVPCAQPGMCDRFARRVAGEERHRPCHSDCRPEFWRELVGEEVLQRYLHGRSGLGSLSAACAQSIPR